MTGRKQFHTSETTKYAHVTFFFNGGIEKANEGEDRKLIDSIDVQDFSSVPQMRAKEITQEVINAVKSGQKSVLKMEAHPEEADALYLVTRDPMNARQSTEHFIRK